MKNPLITLSGAQCRELVEAYNLLCKPEFHIPKHNAYLILGDDVHGDICGTGSHEITIPADKSISGKPIIFHVMAGDVIYRERDVSALETAKDAAYKEFADASLAKRNAESAVRIAERECHDAQCALDDAHIALHAATEMDKAERDSS